jgi:hypothetical protein
MELAHNGGVTRRADPPSPAGEYSARRATWAAAHERRSRQDSHLAYARLATFAAAVVVGVLAWKAHVSGWWLALPGLVFAFLLTSHDRVLRARSAAARLVTFYDHGLARLAERWAGNGEPGDRFRDDTHPYATDLDLFGRGSLFELLSIGRTRAGEETLAAWLKQPAAIATVRGRHDALEELRPALDLREALALAGTQVRSEVNPDALTAWAAAPALFATSARTAAIVTLTIVMVALVAAAIVANSLSPLVLAAVIRTVYQHFHGDNVERVLRRADGSVRELDVLRPALELLERESFQAPVLAELQHRLRTSGVHASAAIRRLYRYAEMHGWSHNLIFTPIAAVVMWNDHLAIAVERWRATYGGHVESWLLTVGEFEALSSLAAYSYEHPDDPLPELAAPPPGLSRGLFVGTGLGHPLLPAAGMIRNDVSLGETAQLLVVSGSNMSGKSTLLRTVGINAVLALAGAPVRAASLRVSPLALGATLRIQDSLQEGRSRFFAEISRIRELADMAATQPLLFLLDELFHGTNSHDRLQGAAGVLRNLVDRGAIGLITTHDLALTAVATDLGARAANVHFEDSFDGVDMRFDYRMKPGPVTRSNALALMRAVGLDVPEQTP